MAFLYITYTGPFTLDLSALQGRIIDVQEGGMTGFRPDLPGFHAMALALTEAMPLHGAAAGIPQEVFDHFVMCNETVDTIDARLAVAEKQIEVLRESRGFYVDARQNDVGLMADAMRSRAQRRKDRTVLIPFEKVLKYNGQIGKKALHTRKKNEQAKADEAASETPAPAPDAPAPAPAPAAAPAPYPPDQGHPSSPLLPGYCRAKLRSGSLHARVRATGWARASSEVAGRAGTRDAGPQTWRPGARRRVDA